MNIYNTEFGETPDGPAKIYTLENDNGIIIKITNYGGIIVSLLVPDKDGKSADVVLGFETLEEYLKDSPYFGCITGRYANRISKAKFRLNGQEYQLAANDGNNHLHGGDKGFDKVLWQAETIEAYDSVDLVLSYLSKDGEEGYPGTLDLKVTYTLTADNELKIIYQGTTDQDTIVNLTNHSYFNLAGRGDILGHEMMINADKFTYVDEESIPSGEHKTVEGTPMDFREVHTVGERIRDSYQQLNIGPGGYDHNYLVNRRSDGLELAARTRDPESGRSMETWTTEPGIQLYSGNFLDGSIIGKGGQVYNKNCGLCLETQHYPDSPNQPDFPSTVLKAGETYQTTTVYKFSAE